MEEGSPFDTGVVFADALWLIVSALLVAVELVRLQHILSGSFSRLQPFEVLWILVWGVLLVTTIIWFLNTAIEQLDADV